MLSGRSLDDAPKSQPFLKWAGGKRWLANQILEIFPQEFERYFEPFVGSGAIFFALQPSAALISDTNSELINAYQQIKENWHEIEGRLKIEQSRHSKDYYYKVRQSEPESRIDRAVRFIYLNRTCWNGLYRVNLQGKFNVPIGSKQRVDMGDNFEALASSLKKLR